MKNFPFVIENNPKSSREYIFYFSIEFMGKISYFGF